MYTILVTDNNNLVTTVKERIMQRSKLVNSLHFLASPIYNELDMSNFTVVMEYILPISREYISEVLVKSDELYKNMLEYKLPFDTELTKEPGEIEVKLTFSNVGLDEDGNNFQYVRKISATTITIVPIEAWCDIIPDKALDAIDQRIIKTEAQIKALLEAQEVINIEKADNLVLDSENNELYLTAEGNQIGDKVKLSDLGDGIVQSSEEGLLTMMI